jgi:hypothetical protein
VTSSTNDGSYGIGQVIAITVNFSQAVTVTGTPQLTLETGSTDAVVSMASASPTALTFNYTVADGEVSTDLDYAGTSALALNGGTIVNSAGTNADLTLPAPAASDSLGANKALVVDAVAPAPGASGALTLAAASSTVTVSFTNATDSVVANGSLTYRVFYSTTNDISTLEEIEVDQNGTQFGSSYTTNSIPVTGLANGTQYYFNVVVDDGNGNSAVYTSGSATPSLPKKIFLSGTYILDGSGLTGIDAKCNNDKPSGVTGTFKALVGLGSTRRACISNNCATGGASENSNWVLQPNTAYVNLDNEEIGTTTASAIFTFPLSNSVDQGAARDVATGINGTWTNSSTSHCGDWTANVWTVNFIRGDNLSTSSNAISIGIRTCDYVMSFYCVEQ